MVNKTITHIKQYFFLLALVATFVGFSAFKFVERFDEPEDGWYLVTITGAPASDPQNQQIGAKTTTPPLTDSEDCARSNLGDICAVKLEFDTSDQDNLPEMPETVADAENDALVDVTEDAGQPLPEQR